MENLMLAIQHRLNPLHLYCRLMDKGVKKRYSMLFSRYYEILIYKWLIPITNGFIFLARLAKKMPLNRKLVSHAKYY
jgi:hypothetical protein